MNFALSYNSNHNQFCHNNNQTERQQITLVFEGKKSVGTVRKCFSKKEEAVLKVQVRTLTLFSFTHIHGASNGFYIIYMPQYATKLRSVYVLEEI